MSPKSLKCSSVARGGAGGARASSIGLGSMQNRMFFVLLRPILCEIWKIAPPFENSPPQTSEFAKLDGLGSESSGGLGVEPLPPVAMGVWEQSPQSLGNFCKFLERKSYFNAVGSRFARVHSHLKELVFLTFESQSKKFNCSILLLLAIKVQNTFKILHCGVKF